MFRRLTTRTSNSAYFNDFRIDELYLRHADALRSAGLAPATFLTIGSIRKSLPQWLNQLQT